jgi:hypothetical protein
MSGSWIERSTSWAWVAIAATTSAALTFRRAKRSHCRAPSTRSAARSPTSTQPQSQIASAFRRCSYATKARSASM